MPRSILAEGAPPSGVRYVAGWCYAVSRDVLLHVLRAAQAYERQPELQPPWYRWGTGLFVVCGQDAWAGLDCLGRYVETVVCLQLV